MSANTDKILRNIEAGIKNIDVTLETEATDYVTDVAMGNIPGAARRRLFILPLVGLQ